MRKKVAKSPLSHRETAALTPGKGVGGRGKPLPEGEKGMGEVYTSKPPAPRGLVGLRSNLAAASYHFRSNFAATLQQLCGNLRTIPNTEETEGYRRPCSNTFSKKMSRETTTNKCPYFRRHSRQLSRVLGFDNMFDWFFVSFGDELKLGV